jgi:AmmeMemoRadiSam system protein A
MPRIEFSINQKKDLLKTARMTIERMLTGKESPGIPSLSDKVFSESYGIFVTLKKGEDLRGCIGNITGEKPLRDSVKEIAIESAFRDPRFTPLSKNELEKLKIEISILYPLEEVKDVGEIVPGKHGIVLERGYQKGLLLPQVATENGWGRDEFLNQTCRKAGMENYCWENDAKVYKFEAVVFNEKELGV